MAAAIPFCTMQLGYSPSRRVCDLVVSPAGGGRGSIAVDQSPASALLIAFGTDRRARADDALPGNATGLLARRGWCGALVTGQEIGSRFWLLGRAKQTEPVRVAGEGYAAEAVSDIADRHGIAIDTSCSYPSRDVMLVTAQAQGVRFSLPVQLA